MTEPQSGEQLRGRDRRAIVVVGGPVGLLSGAAQFLSSYVHSGLQLLVTSGVVVAAGLGVTLLVVRGWNMGRRKVLLSINLIVLIVVALVAVGLLGGWAGHKIGVYAFPEPTPSSTPALTAEPVRSPSPPSSANPTPSAMPSSPAPVRMPPPPVSPKVVSVACGAPTSARPGQTITLTYGFNAAGPIVVGLGAGLYDTAGGDHANGDGDVDEASLAVGGTVKTRPFTVPPGLTPGTYELVAEVWPANQIGEGETLAEGACGALVVG
ncbi:hypothetical protein ACPPVO_22515 [Dactylosporangium sp. McL0621]|uniref:hypothetical protein n=1 Tax=Dactylosporangium sp. McL0621 TaxID=3415678 RepID=UPI003CF63004